MKPEDYMPKALRTLYPDLTQNDRLGLCGLGMLGELGEVIDLLKKFLYHRNGKPLDVNKIKDELGDVLWYLAVLLDTVGLAFEQVMEVNATQFESRRSDLGDIKPLECYGLELAASVGRVVDLLNQSLYRRMLLDVNKIKDELRNVFLYLFFLLDTIGITFEDVMEANAIKLEKRHGNGFNPRYASDSGASA